MDDRTDRLGIDAGVVRYSCDNREAWCFDVHSLRLIAEWTNDHGPWLDDYFYIFAVGEPVRFYEAPMYANPGILEELGRALGVPLKPALVQSTVHDSRVLWPEHLRGEPFFALAPARRPTGVWNRAKDRVVPLVSLMPTEAIAAYLGTGKHAG